MSFGMSKLSNIFTPNDTSWHKLKGEQNGDILDTLYLSMGGCWDLVLGRGNKDSCSSESIVSCIWLRFSKVNMVDSSLKTHFKPENTPKAILTYMYSFFSIKDFKVHAFWLHNSVTTQPFSSFYCAKSTFIIYTWKYKLSHCHSYTFFLTNNNSLEYYIK